MMDKFYAIGVDTKGKSQRINFDDMGENAPKYLYQAEREGRLLAKKEGLVFQNAYLIQGTEKQASTMTKFFKDRKRTGKNGKSYNQSL